MNFFFKIFDILESKHKKFLFVILFFLIINSILEVMGLSLIIPLLIFLSGEPSNFSLPFFDNFFIDTQLAEPKMLIIFSLISIFVLYTIKTTLMLIISWYQAKFQFKIQAEIAIKLFTFYLRAPYSLHLEKNSSDMIRGVISDVGLFRNIINQTLLFITSFLIFLFIFFLLILIEPIGAFIVFLILGGAGSILFISSKKYIKKIGIQRQLHDGLQIQQMNQGLGAIKEVKVSNRENFFTDNFNFHNIGLSQVGAKQAFIASIPRLGVEFIAMLTLCLFIVILINSEKPLSSLIPIIGIFGGAAFRLIPSFNAMIVAIQSIRYFMPSLNNLHSSLKDFKFIEKKIIKKEQLDFKELKIENLTFGYENTSKDIFSNINLNIKKGEFVGIIGESGVGKTTLIDNIIGLLEPTSGKISFDNKNSRDYIDLWKTNIGYIPQEVYLTDDSIKNNIIFGLEGSEIYKEKLTKAIEMAEIYSFINSLPLKENTIIGERGARISGGQKQRIGIARALYLNPAILIMDESTSNLDELTESEILKTLMAQKGKITVIFITHRISTLKTCDSIYKLDKSLIKIK